MPFTVKTEHLAAIAGRSTTLMSELATWMNKLCPTYEIDSAQEYSHFLAQACHETDHFKTLREYASGSCAMRRETVDLGKPRRSAARLKLPASATRAKISRSLGFNCSMDGTMLSVLTTSGDNETTIKYAHR